MGTEGLICPFPLHETVYFKSLTKLMHPSLPVHGISRPLRNIYLEDAARFMQEAFLLVDRTLKLCLFAPFLEY